MSVTHDAGIPRSPGRPRDPGVAEAILEAVVALLAEGASIEALSIEAVAARAGVGKATIYRRWPGKEELIMSAIESMKGRIPEPKGESVRADLLAMACGVRLARDIDRDAKVLPCIALEMRRNPKFAALHRDLIESRREVTRGILRRGVETGELRADIDIEVVMLMLSSPMLVNKLYGPHHGIDPDRLPEIVVDTVLAGVAGPALAEHAPPPDEDTPA